MLASMRAPFLGVSAAVFLALSLSAAPASASDVTVCVKVRTKSWSKEPPAPERDTWKYTRDPNASSGAASGGFDASAYLTRMIEYEVTHEVGFAAVQKDCAQQLDVELYPLTRGWTVFARYSGNQREEKVDFAGEEELAVLAQRVTRALLRDVPVDETITRRSVLAADTERRLRTVGVQGHLLFGLGTAFRFGSLPSADDQGVVKDRERYFTPATVTIGYRGKFQQYGLDAFTRVNLGLSEHTPSTNTDGGHVDYEGGLNLGLHFLYYFDPDGLTSLYTGGGASFELTLLGMIRPEDQRQERDRDMLLTGGLNVDALVGYEFMRASAIHFFTQLELNVPTYAIHGERRWGVVDSYLPGAAAQIGVIF
jgi:hypothetical protein